jgi:hypothetical protein
MNGTVDRGRSGRDGSIVLTANSGIPCTAASLQTSDFVQTQNEANNTNILKFYKNRLLSLLVQVGKGFQIRPELRYFITGRFWYSKLSN